MSTSYPKAGFKFSDVNERERDPACREIQKIASGHFSLNSLKNLS